jgi:carnitine 3-dehydrogenase
MRAGDAPVPLSRTPSEVTLVGTGVIGSGWAAHFLRNGFDVVAWDPSERARNHLPQLVEQVWPTLEAIGLRVGASPDRLRVVSTLTAAVEAAEFVQESGPERLEDKADLFSRITAEAPPDTIVASSTSGLRMSDIQRTCVNPERTVVGHPFSPAYLVPLVEIVGGGATATATLEWVTSFYEHSGMRPLLLEGEFPGFIGNRLQEALWREMLHMLAAGEATLEQMDAAIVDGPGLRWAIMGPALTLLLAGGEGGVARALDLYDGPGGDWTRLESPPMTPELRTRIIEGCEAIAAGRSPEELRRWRDEALLALRSARESTADTD